MLPEVVALRLRSGKAHFRWISGRCKKAQQCCSIFRRPWGGNGPNFKRNIGSLAPEEAHSYHSKDHFDQQLVIISKLIIRGTFSAKFFQKSHEKITEFESNFFREDVKLTFSVSKCTILFFEGRGGWKTDKCLKTCSYFERKVSGKQKSSGRIAKTAFYVSAAKFWKKFIGKFLSMHKAVKLNMRVDLLTKYLVFFHIYHCIIDQRRFFPCDGCSGLSCSTGETFLCVDAHVNHELLLGSYHYISCDFDFIHVAAVVVVAFASMAIHITKVYELITKLRCHSVLIGERHSK